MNERNELKSKIESVDRAHNNIVCQVRVAERLYAELCAEVGSKQIALCEIQNVINTLEVPNDLPLIKRESFKAGVRYVVESINKRIRELSSSETIQQTDTLDE